jgi:hypothetical protein
LDLLDACNLQSVIVITGCKNFFAIKVHPLFFVHCYLTLVFVKLGNCSDFNLFFSEIVNSKLQRMPLRILYTNAMSTTPSSLVLYVAKTDNAVLIFCLKQVHT